MHLAGIRKIFLSVYCLLAVVGYVGVLGSPSLEGAYLIRARPIEDIPEALAILRRFIARGPSEAKCERYAVLLNSLTSSQVNQFSIAELGLASIETVRQQFRRIDVETLRQLYIDAINKFKGDHFDQSMLQLMDCLSQKFRTIDAKARSFLNNKTLQELVNQYKSIMDQPLDFLLDPNYQHPTLRRDQVDHEIKQTLLNLFNGDSAKVESRFSPILTQSSGAQPTAAEAPIQVGVLTQTSDEGDQFAAGSVQSNIFETGSVQVDDLDLSSDEREYLADFLESIHKLYNTLPLAAQLNDRCEAYAKLTQAEPKSLKEGTVETIVLDANNKIAASGPTEKVYVPDRSVRENFLFSLKALGRKELGDEIWIDLVDCVSQWEQEDTDVAQFMKSAELAKAYEELSKEIELAEQANTAGVDGATLEEPRE